VRVYRGLPDGSLDPKGHSAASRQIDIWRQHPQVQVFPRPLSYPQGWPDRSLPGEKPREKGIDVSLAIDFVVGAVTNEYDVGILMSTDTDLKPALEAVTALAGVRVFPRAEVAAWSGDGMRNRRLSIPGSKPLWCHWCDKTTYAAVCDHTDYSDSAWS
jgi:NYN domain